MAWVAWVGCPLNTTRVKDYYLDTDPVAQDFLCLYNGYIHAVDDLIDKPVSDKAEAVLNVCVLHRSVMAHPFWKENATQLLLIDILIENAYRDSERLKTTHPKAARMWSMYGELMIFAVLAIVKGEDFLRKVSTAIRLANLEEQEKDVEYGK